jgi:hypothetical protein
MTRVLFLVAALTSGGAVWAQESVYDLALLKREYIGKNEIYTVVFKNESGKIVTMNGYIRPSAAENTISLYSFNMTNRNYDILEIRVPNIRSITKAEAQTVLIHEKEPVITTRGILQAAGVILIAASITLLIFYKEL